MATVPMSADASPLPWAKIAASAGKDNVALTSGAAAGTSPTPLKENNQLSNEQRLRVSGYKPYSKPNSFSSTSVRTKSREGISADQDVSAQDSLSKDGTASLVKAVQALSHNEPMPSLVVDGSGISVNNRAADSIDGFSEDAFQRADSESELGTKPPSLDGKSITSGTTFALDEKESLRPDDSASVKAAEDDDTFSGRGSIVAGSRIGSEAAARAYRAQLHDAVDRRNIQPLQERPIPGVITPLSGSSGQHVADELKAKPLDGVTPPEGFNIFYRQAPDEKLLEALDSPKDRIFLLRLEQEVIEFVKDSKEPFVDLPPSNSFCRMLTHKLADYYHMTHQVDTVAGSVRIFRTPFCRLPPSLTSISNPPTTGNTPPMATTMMKIMRRGGDGDTGPSPSKTTSETGSDGKDKALSAKEKLSREEREAAYMRARERIFGNTEKTGDATPDTEDGNEMSRSSSVSTKDRLGQSKKSKPLKQRRDDSDTFDSRASYTPYYPAPQAPTWVAAPPYGMMSTQQFNSSVQTIYPGPMVPQYAQPNMSFSQPAPSTGNMQPYGVPQFPQQSQSRFPPSHNAPITTYGSHAQPPSVTSQQWQQPMYQAQAPYQQQQQPVHHPRVPSGGTSQGSIPYQYGQLPNTVNSADPKSQHPIPGSFNRHAFNPKTQSFVPGNTGLPVPQPMAHNGSPHHGSPHHGSPHLNYNAYTPQQQSQFSNGSGYSMARQGSNTSSPPYHVSPHAALRPMMHQTSQQGMPMPQGLSHGMAQGGPQGMQSHIPQGIAQGSNQSIPGVPHGGQVGSHLPNYGNPSSLPPKPPTGA